MNERIKEPFHTLLWKASIGYNDSWSQVDPEVLEKFAELIVSECIGQLNKIPVRAEPLGGQTFNYIKLETAIETLEEYFGVTR